MTQHYSPQELDRLLEISATNDGLEDAEVRPLIESFLALQDENVHLCQELDRIEEEDAATALSAPDQAEWEAIAARDNLEWAWTGMPHD